MHDRGADGVAGNVQPDLRIEAILAWQFLVVHFISVFIKLVSGQSLGIQVHFPPSIVPRKSRRGIYEDRF
jgi:hypothetical protein